MMKATFRAPLPGGVRGKDRHSACLTPAHPLTFSPSGENVYVAFT